MKFQTLQKVIKNPKYYFWYFFGIYVMDYKNPKYNINLYEFCRKYVNFYKNDENGNRETNGMWKWLTEFMQSKPKVIFDIGAFHGDYSTKILELDSTVDLHIFEPNHEAFNKVLVPTFGSSNNVHLIQKGVGERVGNAILYTSKKSGATDSLYYRGDGAYMQDGEVKIELITVDSYCEEKSISFLDFLKIDTEGNDFSVLKGSEKMLKEGKVGTIVFEFSLLCAYSHVYFLDFTNYLGKFGYSVYKIMPNDLHKVERPELERSQHAYFVALKENN